MTRKKVSDIVVSSSFNFVETNSQVFPAPKKVMSLLQSTLVQALIIYKQSPKYLTVLISLSVGSISNALKCCNVFLIACSITRNLEIISDVEFQRVFTSKI